MAFYQEWAKQIRSYNRNIRLALLSSMFIQIGMGIFMVIYNFYIRELGFTEQVNGQIISMTSLATAIVLIPAGFISDRFGRRKVMLIGAILTGVLLICRSVTDIQSLLILFAFLTGMTMAFLQVSGIPWLAENSTQEQRVHLFSIQFAAMTGANVIGNILGGTLTDIFSMIFTEVESIRYTLLIGSIIFLIGIFPIIKFKELPKKIHNKARTTFKDKLVGQKNNYKLVN